MNFKKVVTVLVMACGCLMANAEVWPSDCDLDGSRSVDAVDVQMIINGALGITANIADVNQDGALDAVDVQHVINMALSGARPQLAILELPPFGSTDGVVTGVVYAEKYEICRVALYGHTGEKYVLLSDPKTLTYTGSGGLWTEVANVEPERDSTCHEFLAFLIPTLNDVEVPTGSDTEPVIEEAVDMARAVRQPTVDVGELSILGGVIGKTNADYRYYGALCYVQCDSGRVYPQPLSDPTGSNYLVPINEDGTFHVPLNQTAFGSVVTDYDPSTAVTVAIQIMPLGTDYVDAWPEYVDNLGLNFYDRIAETVRSITP